MEILGLYHLSGLGLILIVSLMNLSGYSSSVIQRPSIINSKSNIFAPARFPKKPNKPMKPSRYTYQTLYFEQTLDHFNFLAADRKYWQRYLVNNQYWKAGGPIFFYTGNEGDIVWFCENTGFMWDIAEEFQAMLVFAEHRYYGVSLPFGNSSYKDAVHLGYLSSEQALADFATLIEYIKSNVVGAEKSPVIAFGGSYGGMLASWFRMKYPGSVAGAISASAPIWGFPGMSNCQTFYGIVTSDFDKAGGSACTSSIQKSWDIITEYARSTSGLQQLSQVFKLCKPLQSYSDANLLSVWLSEVWTNLAMVDYPYPANFLEPLPAWPIKVVCSHLQTPEQTGLELLNSISAAAGVYANYTGTTQCFNIDQQAAQSLGDRGWDFQACTEQVMPFCADGVNDMFPAYKWDFEYFATSCYKQWGVTTRKDWASTVYNGKNISAISNIVFSNGNLDPWSGYGVLKSPSASVVTVMIEDGAHHLDLRAKNALDPESVIKARQVHKENINKWITEFQKNLL